MSRFTTSDFAPLKVTDEGRSYWFKYTSAARIVTTIDLLTKPFSLDGKDYPHGHLHMILRRMVEVPVLDYMAAAVSNKLGYTTQTIADSIANEMVRARDAGASVVYENDHAWTFGNLALSWQQFDDARYCTTASIESTDSKPAAVVQLADALQALGRIVPGDEYASLDYRLSDPTAVYAALIRKGAVLTRTVKTGSSSWDARRVNAIEPRIAFLTDIVPE